MGRDYAMIIATHKHAELPTDALYLPIHVGRALTDDDFGYQPDDDGENISDRNRSYCELTALYWAWKHLDADIVGLSHYRRYFVGTAEGPRGSRILSSGDARDAMRDHDILLGRPRNYYIETIDSHYRHGHHGEDLDALRDVIAERYPVDLSAFDTVMSGRKLSLYNMFLMRRAHFDSYAEWLFDILDRVETRIDNGGRSAYQQRTFGYLGERLLNVWVLARNDQARVTSRRIVNTEGESKLKKGIGLIRRKVAHTAAE